MRVRVPYASCASRVQLDHSVPTVGWVVTETPRPGRLDAAAVMPLLAAQGVHPKRVRELKEGQPLELPDGTVLQPEDFVAAPTQRKLALLSDMQGLKGASSGASRASEDALANATLMVHESTNACLSVDLDKKRARALPPPSPAPPEREGGKEGGEGAREGERERARESERERERARESKGERERARESERERPLRPLCRDASRGSMWPLAAMDRAAGGAWAHALPPSLPASSLAARTCTDCAPTPRLAGPFEVERVARQHGHSTPQMAGRLARKLNADHLVLTHFSPRYLGDSSHYATRIMNEIRTLARNEFHGPVTTALDLMRVTLHLDNTIGVQHSHSAADTDDPAADTPAGTRSPRRDTRDHGRHPRHR